VLAELEQILNELREEIRATREKNREYSRRNKNAEYSQNTMYMVGIYKSMSIISDFIKRELKIMDKWADKESKRINN
jgi:hypothetical protein|tara:strand:+ start:1443 stop:1673 length:231 start_codon:yes stop_codon:yes gene_type:complete